MINNIIIMGRLTRDPELRYTQSETPVLNFTVAVDREGGKEKKADFFPVIAWKQTAEFIHKYFTKGTMIAVVGRLQNREWTDRDGNKRITTEIVAGMVSFCESKRKSEEDSYAAAEREGKEEDADAGRPVNISAGDFEEGDGELPF